VFVGSYPASSKEIVIGKLWGKSVSVNFNVKLVKSWRLK
jgi:hypothetical protein